MPRELFLCYVWCVFVVGCIVMRLRTYDGAGRRAMGGGGWRVMVGGKWILFKMGTSSYAGGHTPITVTFTAVEVGD